MRNDKRKQLIKRISALLMILILTFALGACGSSPKVSASQEAPQVKAPESEDNSNETQETLLVLKDVARMFDPCVQLTAYMATSGTKIDMQNPGADDFWLMLSMVTYAAKPESVGEFGTIDLKEDIIKDIAATFFEDMLEQSEIPSPSGTYSAAYIGAEDLYELQPMSISDMTGQMVSLEEVNDLEGKYLMTIRLADEQQRIEAVDWSVYLDDWEDGEDHFFPYKFVKAIPIS